MDLTIDLDDVLESCSRQEKKELYKLLLQDPMVVSDKERLEKERQEKLEMDFVLMSELEKKNPYELKQVLCNLLNVGSYTDEQTLREKLEVIIKA